MSNAPNKILELVEKYERGIGNYRSSSYNETQVRREFIDPMFGALGWDVDNSMGLASGFTDVIHEDRLTIDGVSKAPDYSFRIGGIRKFFVEAKRPSKNLKDDPAPAKQIRRYAWNAKLEISILTDFEEFIIYDCRHIPDESEGAASHRLAYFSFRDYLEKWDEIASWISKDAVLDGRFDEKNRASKNKRGTSEVDRVFLADMEDWRRLLAVDLIKRNKLTQNELNFAVQQTLDRIVFLRIAEDRGIENYGDLSKATSGSRAYEKLLSCFFAADQKYNSGLFHFQSEALGNEEHDILTPHLKIGNETLKEIIERLYFPRSPYNFRVLPADILGQVYERFLGQVIRITETGTAVIEPKPEVRKAGGVYYTPTYIVNNMVERTLAPALADKSPDSISNLKVLDPASGSGTFLLEAYDYLLHWHLNYYAQSSEQKYKSRYYRGKNNDYFLTVDEKRRILLNNIFGVDIDAQAVEVTKLSLLLKVLEDESESSLATQLQLFHERALPSLHENIKCGNSLISKDFFEEDVIFDIDVDERRRVNAFDWRHEFPNAMAKGGFDVILGNPPYILSREQFSKKELAYFNLHYPSGWEKRNTFLLFMELLLQLVKPTSRAAFIVPNSWLTIESAKLVRDLYRPLLLEVIDLNYQVFEDANVEPSIFVISGSVVKAKPIVMRAKSPLDLINGSTVSIDRGLWDRSQGRLTIPDDPTHVTLVDSIYKEAVEIGSIFSVQTGLQAYEQGKGNPKQSSDDVKNHIYDRTERKDENSYRYLQGRDVGRFSLDWSGMWMQYGPWLSQPRDLKMFTRPRIVLREITSPFPHCFNATFTSKAYLSNKSVLTVLDPDDNNNRLSVLEVILNSRLMSLCYRARAVKGARKLFPKIVIRNLRELPFPKELSPTQIERVLTLKNSWQKSKSKTDSIRIPNLKTQSQRETDSLELALEREVCGLFCLTIEQSEILLKTTDSLEH